MISFRPQRCCHQAFASLMPACHFVEMENIIPLEYDTITSHKMVEYIDSIG
jgi:hypothetical protein